MFKVFHEDVKLAGDSLQFLCHAASFEAGWWGEKGSDVDEVRAGTKAGKLIAATKAALVMCEGAEMIEGLRKGRMDDHLPQYPNAIVEAADTVIRTFDLAGALIEHGAGYTFGDVILAKLIYNAQRADHKPENRAKEGGKAY